MRMGSHKTDGESGIRKNRDTYHFCKNDDSSGNIKNGMCPDFLNGSLRSAALSFGHLQSSQGAA